jgi:hypothetical protein
MKQFAIRVLILFYILSVIGVSQSPGQDTIQKKPGIPDNEIKKVINQNKSSASAWWWTWMSVYGAATVAQSAVAINSSDLSTKQDMWNGAATTFLGMAGLLVTPLVPNDDEIRNKILSSGNKENNSLEFSEAMLKEIARREQFGRSWKTHAVTGIVDLGSGLVTWLGFNRTLKDGLITFALNTVVAEAQIWTQPVRAVRDYNRYVKSGSLSKLNNTHGREGQLYISSLPGGLKISYRF